MDVRVWVYKWISNNSGILEWPCLYVYALQQFKMILFFTVKICSFFSEDTKTVRLKYEGMYVCVDAFKGMSIE